MDTALPDSERGRLEYKQAMEEDHSDDGTKIPFSIAWRKQLYLESVIYRKSRDVELLQGALHAKQAELNAMGKRLACYKNKYFEWKETCKQLTNNHHREARELVITFATEERTTSALVARLPLSQRKELGERIVREYEDMFESTSESGDCAAAANTSSDCATAAADTSFDCAAAAADTSFDCAAAAEH